MGEGDAYARPADIPNNLADALWAANDAVKSAQDSRADERQHRDDEKAGSTPELRKAVSTLLVQCANRVNAVYELDPDNDKAEQAIGKVIALIEEYKRVATEAKHRKGDDPEPEPEPSPEA